MTEVIDRPADTSGDGDPARERQNALRAQYRTLQDMDTRQRSIVAELAQIDQLPDPGEDDLAWQETIIREHDDLDVLAGPLRKRAKDMDRIRAAHADPANREGPEDGTHGALARRSSGPDLATRNVTGGDPFTDLERVRHGLVEPSEVRGRALDAIELMSHRGALPHDWAENSTRMAADNFKGQSKVAQHILMTGSQEYQDAFTAYLENPQQHSMRAALSLTQANGGYLLPFVLDPTIVLTNASSANPWRRISRVVQTTSNTWNGVNSAGVNAAMLAEATIVVDASPTVANIVITPQKGTAWVYGSYEILEDTDFGQQLPALLADAKDRLEESQFATGSGTPPTTQGVVPAATTVGTTATTTGIPLAHIYPTPAAPPPRLRNAPVPAWAPNGAITHNIPHLDT